MEIDQLRVEFSRLSGEYPELRHGVVAGDRDWLFDNDYYRLVEQCRQIVQRDTAAEVIHHDMMSNDVRALSFYLWRGKLNHVRSEEAVAQFRTLARMAAGCVAMKLFPNRIEPRCRVKSGIKVVTLAPGHSIESGPRPNDLDDDWIGHVFVTNAVSPTDVWFNRPNSSGPQCHELWMLPCDLFRASAFALSHDDIGEKKIKPTPNTLAIIREIQAGHDNNKIVSDHSAIAKSVGNVRKIRSLLENDSYEI